MGFGTRKATASEDAKPAKSGGFKKKTSGFGKKGGNADWINLGSITATKKLLEENELYGEICEALDGSEFSFNLKVYTGNEDTEVVLKNGDFITLKFKRGPKDPDFVLGKASLKLED